MTTKDNQHEMLMLLKSIISFSDLSDVPADTLRRLSDLGIIEHDSEHVLHSSLLTNVLSDLGQPQKAELFFRKYYALMGLIANHDKIATDLISVLLLWRNGLTTDEVLKDAIAEYLELAPLFLVKDKS